VVCGGTAPAVGLTHFAKHMWKIFKNSKGGWKITQALEATDLKGSPVKFTWHKASL